MTLQLTIAAGMLAAMGALLIIREFQPRHPHLVDTAGRLTDTTDTVVTHAGDSGDLTDRVGRLVLHRAGTWPILRIPHRDLGLLNISVARFLGEKALAAAIGLATPAASTLIMSTIGWTPPLAIPTAASLALAIAASYVPNWTVAEKARAARTQWARAMTSYIDLVALERAGGAGPIQALEHAALIGDSWVFHRLRDELARARYRGTPAWDALRAVGDELRLPELAKMGDVMRLAGEGATVYENLRARAHDMRAELLTTDKARAGIRTERAVAPVAMTGVIFAVILVTPMALQLIWS